MGARRTIDMGTKGYIGSIRCPACGALGSSQAAIGRHIMKKRDPAHSKLKNEAEKRLGG